MRISDWSSDVCSSDLRQWIGRRGRAPGQPQGQRPRSKSGVARIMFLNPMLFAAALFTTPATPQTVVDDLLNVDRSFSSAAAATDPASGLATMRSEEHTSELQSLMRISYAVFCLKKKKET